MHGKRGRHNPISLAMSGSGEVFQFVVSHVVIWQIRAAVVEVAALDFSLGDELFSSLNTNT